MFWMKKTTVLAVAVAGAIMLQPMLHAQSAAPTDPQIAGVVVAANQIDIAYAKLALTKSKNHEVRDFAQQMITDHTALQKSVADLAAKLKVTPEESDISKSLKSQAEETTKKLKALRGKAFDKAYIDNEVAYHQAVIGAASKVLIPNAKNAELKSALEGAAPLLQGHLEHAQKVQGDLEHSASAGSKGSK